MSPGFRGTREVQQECSLSLLHFVLSFDVVLRRLESCSGVHGFPPPASGVTSLSCYSDDL